MIIARIKAAALWFYNWVTVIVASLVGVPELVVQALSYLDGIDITPIFGPDTALRVVTGVALAKAAFSIIASMTNKEEE